ncbi:hypothetical protein [Paracoccus ravus]|uniref:hypothetical protein n=1 Tax=Paracoccus ravus TaxID=2447760 RepID=UPI00106EF097|nr:hypothetical protein [Paracoccus ravus]
MEVTLIGILTLGVAIAAMTTIAGVVLLELSFWAAFLLYMLSGTVATLFIGWRRFRCVEEHETLGRS